MEMKTDLSNFFGRAFGRLLILIGAIVGFIIAFSSNGWVGFILGLGLVIYGKFIIFKANRRYGYILYQGGKIYGKKEQ
jgi:hypothetical protein